MGNYASQSDLQDTFGTVNIAKWSQLTPAQDNTTADTARIATAIARAEAKIDDRFRFSMYQVPLQGLAGIPQVLIDWVAVYAGAWLYRSRDWGLTAEMSASIEARELQVKDEIDGYLAGSSGLNCTLKAASNSHTTLAPEIRF